MGKPRGSFLPKVSFKGKAGSAIAYQDIMDPATNLEETINPELKRFNGLDTDPPKNKTAAFL
jgi:hypothetical protein